MHDDPRTPPDNPLNRSHGGDETPTGDGASDAAARHIPLPLQNWQVLESPVEIEGEATVLADPEPVDPARSATIADRQDAWIGLGLDARRYGVEPGATVTLQVDLLNNGPTPALFEVNLEGWIDEAWIPDLPVRVHLTPGSGRTIQLTLALPHGSAARAGDYAFAVTAQTARFAGHLARCGAVLAVARHTALQLGSPQPRRVRTSWLRPSALVHVPLRNQSNHPVRVSLRGLAPQQAAHFTFYPPHVDADLETDEVRLDGQPGERILQLDAGAAVLAPVRIEPVERPWVGLLPLTVRYRLAARVVDEPSLRRAVEGQVAVAPLVGPWQMGIAALVALVAIVGMGLTGLALLLALRTPAAPAQPVVAATPVPPAVFVIQLEQPAPTRAPGDVAPDRAAGTEAAVPRDAPLSVPIAPVVRADQVTAPGEPTRANQTPLQPLAGAAVVATPTAVVITAPGSAPVPQSGGSERSSAAAGMTYGEMFREIGLRYDWDWRLLAAQAYIESGFDSLALSGAGAMGLMQIRPPTWREWAPQVAATDPFDSYSNVLVAALYLDYLRTLLSERGYSQLEWTLVAYYWGPDEVLDYLAAGGTWESLDASLRQYAEDIRRIAQTIPAN